MAKLLSFDEKQRDIWAKPVVYLLLWQKDEIKWNIYEIYYVQYAKLTTNNLKL